MAAQQQQGQGGGDNGLAALWIIALLFVTAGLIWYVAHSYIVAFVFQLKLYEAYAANFFTNSLNQLINLMQNANPASVSFDDMLSVSTAVGDYIRYPVVVILVVLAILLYRGDVTRKFRNTYTTKKLLEIEYPNWPHVTPILKLNLVDQDPDKGPWAMALSPRAFCEKHKLLKKEVTAASTPREKRKAELKVTIKKGEARRLFTMQLAEYWEGPEMLPMPARAIFALCAAKANRNREDVTKLLTQISSSSATGKLDFTGVNELLKRYKNTKAVKDATDKHAYVMTVMASLLEKAREDGVFPTSEFLWLKPVNRRLWYMLNSVGRQTPFTEVAGAFAHWLAEKELNRKCMVPMVEEAVNALEGAILDIKFKREDFSEGKDSTLTAEAD